MLADAANDVDDSSADADDKAASGVRDGDFKR